MIGRAMPPALLGVVAILIAGCSSSGSTVAGSSQSPVTGTITGTLSLNGGPAGHVATRAAGEVYAFISVDLSGTAVATAKVNTDGTFQVQVPAGTYYLAATSPDYVLDPAPSTPPCGRGTSAVVTPGGTTQVALTCEMK